MADPTVIPTNTHGGMSLSNIPILNTSEDWTRWNREMRDYLIFSGYAELLDGPNAEKTTMQPRACAAIRNRCGYNAYTIAEDMITVFDMFKALMKDFKPSGPGTFALLCQRFQELTIADCKDVSDYVEQFRKTQNELRQLEKTLVFPAPFLVQKFLHGLGPAYAIFRTTFNQTRNILPEIDKPAVTFDVTARAAIVEERSMRSDETASQAFYTHYKLKQQPNGRSASEEKVCTVPGCGKKYHVESECWITHPELKAEHMKQKEKKRRVYGERDERKKQRKANDEKEKGDENESTNQLIFMAQSGLGVDLTKVFPLDSACTQHTVYDKSLFTEYHTISQIHTIGGIGGVSCKPLGHGTISLPMNVKGTKYMMFVSGVLHSPDVGVNLLSVDQFQRNGVDIRLASTGFTLQKDSSPIFETTRYKGFYLMNLWGQNLPINRTIQYAMASYSLSDPTIQIWHERMGHLGEAGLKKLEGMATGIDLKRPYKNICTCEACVYGRMKENPHNHLIKSGEHAMDLIHIDLCGPFPILGANGERYWMTFLDDATQASEVVCLKNKREAPKALKEYLLRNEHPERRCHYIRVVETSANDSWIDFVNCVALGPTMDISMSDRTPAHLQRKTHRIRLDQESVLSSNDMKNFLKEKGIVAEVTATDQHQQNGSAERLNGVLMDKLHPMLLSAKLDKKYWPHAVLTANYLRNRSPQAILNCTPYEKWHRTKPDLSHIRAFGCTAFARVIGPKKIRDVKAIKCKLLGFESSTIYRLLTPQGKVIHWNNVHFDEPKPNLKRPAEIEPEISYRIPHMKAVTTTSLTPTPQYVGASSSDGGELELEIPSDDQSPLPASLSTEINSMTSRSPSPSSQLTFDTEHVGVPSAEPHLSRTQRRHPDLHVRRSTRPNRATLDRTKVRHATWALLTAAMPVEPYEPQTYKQAVECVFWRLWEKGMKEEMDQLLQNNTWTLVDYPPDRKVLRGRWVYRLKRGPHGEVLRHKARWVVRGFEQVDGRDFYETFASVVKPMSYKALFALAAALDLEIEQMDVKTAFLYGTIAEEIYVEQPLGMDDGTPRVCKLLKALYGLKQAPRVWYDTLTAFLSDLGFKPLSADLSVFVRDHVFIAVYVDDLLIFGPLKKEIQEIKDRLSERFKMTDIGPVAYYLGMEITRDRPNRTIYLSQAGYIDKVIRNFDLSGLSPVKTPMDPQEHFEKSDEGYEATEYLRKWYQSAVGSLMYAMLGTRPDLAYAVSVVSRYSSNPNDKHQKAVKRIFRYLNGTVDLTLTYRGDLMPLNGYTDADWAGDRDTRRSTSGFTFNIGSGALSWQSKRQPTVALSSCEAEYMGQTQATKEAVWLKALLKQLDEAYEAPVATIIHCDNQGAMALAKNPEFHARSKHIGIQHHFVREKISNGDIELKFVPTEQQIADGLTKALPKDRFEAFRRALGLELPRRINKAI